MDTGGAPESTLGRAQISASSVGAEGQTLNYSRQQDVEGTWRDTEAERVLCDYNVINSQNDG